MAIRGEKWVGADPSAVADEATRRFVAAAQQSIAARDRFTVALAGGSTPKATYERLAKAPHKDAIDWQKVDIFFSDERSVPPNHADSNYGMAARALLDHVPLNPLRVHRILGERDDAHAKYAATLERAFGNRAIPVFDLILLGMGPDGHTASLFPHTTALDAKSAWVAKNHVAKLNTDRFTFTAPLINAAREVLITACGAEKAPVLKKIAEDAEDPKEHPILLVRPGAGKLVWLVDKATGV